MENFTLTQGQQKVFDHIISFLEDSSKDFFILKGYAGTGKTTLITYLGDYLQKNNLDFDVLTPTGRAAKVLKESFAESVNKYGFCEELGNKGRTIHSEIYSSTIECKEVESEDFSKKSVIFYFPLDDKLTPDNNKRLLIIDESSMVGDNIFYQEFLRFGTGRLLSDILEYKRIRKIEKIIFVGDDAQLPPVGDAESRALDETYFSDRGYGVETDVLTEVLRQNEESTILKNAISIRELLERPRLDRSGFDFMIDNDVENVSDINVPRTIADMILKADKLDDLLVCYSNNQCYIYNQAIREILFTDGETIKFNNEVFTKLHVGDRLLNCANSHGTFGLELFNGDFLKVVDVRNSETHHVPVRIKGDAESMNVSLSFTFVKLATEGGREFDAVLLDNSLYSKERDLQVIELRALYIDLCMRIRKMYPYVKEGTAEFKDLLKKDVYFNALRVKFGYAITCHKAQGGEWDTVWVDFSQRIGMTNDILRWCYTATTRAKKRLKVIHPPHVSSLDKLDILPIAKVSKAPKGFFKEAYRQDEPGTENAPVGVSLKIKGVRENIKQTPYILKSVSVFGYQIKFVFVHNGNNYSVDCYFDGEGVLKHKVVSDENSAAAQINRIINESLYVPEDIGYEPSNQILSDFYERMTSIAEDVGVKIVNVIECPQQYYVLYCLKTNTNLAYVQFYYRINGSITKAMPKSELGDKDEKLQVLLENI